jgi:periplasmic divalent cation tolerance protein
MLAAMLHVILVTAPPAEAPALVRTLVGEGLVACGNILPGARSIYRWQGALCDDEEAVVLMETTPERVRRAIERIRELHTYECPKVVALAAATVLDAYARWVTQSVQSG